MLWKFGIQFSILLLLSLKYASFATVSWLHIDKKPSIIIKYGATFQSTNWECLCVHNLLILGELSSDLSCVAYIMLTAVIRNEKFGE